MLLSVFRKNRRFLANVHRFYIDKFTPQGIVSIIIVFLHRPL